MRGIDTSKWNNFNPGLIDYTEFEFWSMKAGGGDDGIYRDPSFEKTYTASLKTKYRQAYWFLGRNTNYKDQIDTFLSVIKDKDFNIIPCLDIEHPANSAKDDSLDWYLKEVYPYAASKFGFYPISYSAAWWLDPRNEGEYPREMLWWLASYTPRLVYPNKMRPEAVVAWQKSETGKIKGFYGNVDIDEVLNLEAIKIENKVAYVPPPPFVPYETVITDTYEGINFRKEPKINAANVVGFIGKGEPIKITGESSNGWTPAIFPVNGWVKSELIVPRKEVRKKVPFGIHDFHDGSLGNVPVMVTMEMNQNLDVNKFQAEFEKGVNIYLRCSWNYSWPSVPKNAQDIKDMRDFYRRTLEKVGKYVKGIHIFNEPNLEVFPFGYLPEYLADIHNIVSEEIRKVSDVKISPAPLAWYAGTYIPNTWNLIPDQETPKRISERFWGAIKPIYRDLYIAHTYSFGDSQDPNEKFTNWPLLDTYRSIRNIESQFEAMRNFNYGDVPVFIGETNFTGDRGIKLDFDTDWFLRTQEYFSKFPQIVGAAFFRWNQDTVNGQDYGIWNKPRLQASLRKTL